MQTIIAHLWFDTQAVEAATFYATLFPDSRVNNVRKITGTPSGDCDIVSFTLAGKSFMAISAGPAFKINPSISFMVNFDPSQNQNAEKDIEELWAKLLPGGKVMMPFSEYPFSKKYGWIEDVYGVSWQLILTNPAGEPRPMIMTSMMFTGSNAGKAEEATNFYISLFKNSRRGTIARYPAGMEPDKEGTIMFTDFSLGGDWFTAIDSAHKHEFVFNEALSFIVHCDTQEEINYFWGKLSHVPESEMCGWCKDQYGVSWQITPRRMGEMMATGTPEQLARVTAAFMQMKKFDIQKLEAAFLG